MRWLAQRGSKDLDVLDVGCGAGWMCERMQPYGHITGIDFADEVLARTAARNPGLTLIGGDFMEHEFHEESYDVAVSLEVLSHVPDQAAFLAKVARLLRPGGYLMLATQNRPQLERNRLPAPLPGQIRKWVDRNELAQLLAPQFVIEELFAITPQCNRGILRVLNSHKLNGLLAALRLGSVTRTIKTMQERAWLGWTLMCLARKRHAA